jgi:thiopeptide-type bacteriocin biosynthesis protein
VQLETYDREVERYGGEIGIDVAERFFHADSVSAVDLIETASGVDPVTRWQLSLKSVGTLLTDFGLGDEELARFVDHHRNGAWRILKCEKPLRRELSAKFRAERRELGSVLDGTVVPADVTTILARRSTQVAAIAAEYSALARAHAVTTSRDELYHTFVHMHVNRLVAGKATAHELVIADFLAQLYASRKARLLSCVGTDCGARGEL